MSRAALLAMPDPSEMRNWLDGTVVDLTNQSPYSSALISEEGFRAALELLQGVAKENIRR